MKDFIKLIKFLRGHERLFSLAATTMIISSFFEVFQMSLLVPLIDVVFNNKEIKFDHELPRFFQSFVDQINAMDQWKLFILIMITFGTMMVLKNVFVFFYQYLMGDVSQRVMRDIRYKLFAKIQHLSLEYFSQKRTGELISRITNDVNLVENAVSYGLTDLFRQSFMILFCISVAFAIDTKAAFVIFIVVPLIGYPMSRIGKMLRKISKETQEKVADMTSLLLETISGVRVVKAFNTEDYEIERFRKQNYSYYKLLMRSIKRLILIQPVTEILGSFFAIGLLFFFAPKIISQQVSFGVFGYFLGSIMMIISPIKKLGNVYALTQKALAAGERIYEVLETKVVVVEKQNPVEFKSMVNGIRLTNVNFRYTSDSDNVLKSIEVEIKKGQVVAIVGPTGSGKTTLVNLLPRFYDPSQGVVTIDGIDMRDISFSSLRRQFGIVSQETVLFNDTVKANIAYGFEGATQEQIEAAAQKAFAHQFIIKMPNGYNTIVGDRGFRLSGGEKQRISIARAILRNPPILIMDEATSQLDSESEKFVQVALDELMKGRTVVAIAHRLSTILNADKIVVIEKGRIVGMDKHEALLKSCPLYDKLYRMQFQT